MVRAYQASRWGRLTRVMAPYALGIAVFGLTPTTIAYQDIVSLIANAKKGERWQAYLQASSSSTHKASFQFDNGKGDKALSEVTVPGPTGTPQAVSMNGIDPIVTGAIPTKKRTGQPVYPTVNREGKGDRLISRKKQRRQDLSSSTSASVFTYASLLSPGKEYKRMQMAFVKTRRPASAVQVAHKKAKPRPNAPQQLLAGVAQKTSPHINASQNLERKGTAQAEMIALLKKGGGETATKKAANVTLAAFAPSQPTINAVLPKPKPALAPQRGVHMSKLPRAKFSKAEYKCLAEAIYFEARGESDKGQMGVAQVVINRMKHKNYPSNLCSVVYQNRTWRNRCQFSFACDGIPERINERSAWAKAKDITERMLTGNIWLTSVGNATHYHATYVRPRWSRTLRRVTRIGTHIFYRFRGRRS